MLRQRVHVRSRLVKKRLQVLAQDPVKQLLLRLTAFVTAVFRLKGIQHLPLSAAGRGMLPKILHLSVPKRMVTLHRLVEKSSDPAPVMILESLFHIFGQTRQFGFFRLRKVR
jgi:hypothetical protein